MTFVTSKHCPSPVDLNLVFPLDQPLLGQPAAARCGAEAAGGSALTRHHGVQRQLREISCVIEAMATVASAEEEEAGRQYL